MCGRLNIIDDPAVSALCEWLQIPLWPDQAFDQRFVRAGQSIPIIRERDGQRRMDMATWWLLLDQVDDQFKLSKYTSFNTRYDKLNQPRSAGYQAFRQSRCVIPAKGFGETQKEGSKYFYHDMVAQEGEAIAFGGLCRDWRHHKTGEVVTSCSVITLPPHEKLTHIHKKSMPLILPQDKVLIDSWLSSSVNNVEQFSPLLAPYLPQDLTAYPIDKPSSHQFIGMPEFIEKDG